MCVSAGVHCGVLFRVRGAARSLNTLGFHQGAFRKGETPATASPHTTDSPSPSPLCASRQHPEPLALFLLDHNFTETSHLVSPDRLASRADPSWLCSTQLDHFRPGEHTQLLRHRTSLSRVSRLCAQHLVSSRLDSHLESRD